MKTMTDGCVKIIDEIRAAGAVDECTDAVIVMTLWVLQSIGKSKESMVCSVRMMRGLLMNVLTDRGLLSSVGTASRT